jgi:hypothetical protein
MVLRKPLMFHLPNCSTFRFHDVLHVVKPNKWPNSCRKTGCLSAATGGKHVEIHGCSCPEQRTEGDTELRENNNLPYNVETLLIPGQFFNTTVRLVSVRLYCSSCVGCYSRATCHTTERDAGGVDARMSG